jgi:hypothetical protein
VGEGGRTLADTWAGSPIVHRTVGVPGFPNYFVVFGPYSPIGNGSIIENSEVQVDYITQCIDLIARGELRALNPRREVAERQKQEICRALEGTVCRAAARAGTSTPTARRSRGRGRRSASARSSARRCSRHTRSARQQLPAR